MKTIYTVSFIGFFSLYLAVPTKGNPNEIQYPVNIKKYSNIDYNFDPENINVEVFPNWTNAISISAISSENDPKENIVLTNNISLQVIKHGDHKWISNLIVLEKTERVKIYEKHDKTLFNEVSKKLVTENGAVTSNISLGVLETIHRQCDFSNLSAPSIIDYNITIITQVNITYPNTTFFEEVLNDYEEFEEPEPEDSVHFLDGLISLGATSGKHTFDCNKGVCTSNVDASFVFETLQLSKNIEAKKLTTVSPGAYCSQTRLKDGMAMYSQVMKIFVRYMIEIGNKSV